MHSTESDPSGEPASRLDRRSFAKFVAATVVGFNLATSSWVAAADRDRDRDPLARVPRLDGELLVDAASRDAYGQDFGQIVFERPLAVLRPGSVDDVSAMLRFARRHGIRVVGRGAAHTTFGQSQVAAGITFDLTTFDHIGPIENGFITVGAGCRWRDVLAATLAAGVMPVVLPDYIGQTVGGTLSVGGIGAMSFHHGAQIDHVVRLRAVTGDGRIIECSGDHHRELFEMLLAGQGQVGVIVEATMRVVPAPSTVRLFDLVYPSLDELIADTVRLVDDGRFDQMEAFCIPLGGGAYLHLLEAIAYHPDGGEPDDVALLGGLRAIAEQTAINDIAFADWANRVGDPPTRPNPWIDLLVPASQAVTFVGEVEAQIAPIVAGDSFSLLLIPMRDSLFTRPLFRAPEEEISLGFDTLRALPPGTDVTEAIAFNRRLYDRCVARGGTTYPISAVRLDRSDWQRHYGEQFGRLLAAKRRFDGANVLASGPDILGC